MKKGDVIYYTNKERGGKYSELCETTVTKVGRDYFETALNRRKIPLKINEYDGSWIDGYISDEHNR